MPELKTVYDKQEDIPETVEFRDLFTQKGERWELTGISGIQTPANVQRLETSLKKERDEHKTTKEKLAAWEDLEPEEVRKSLDRIAELEAAAGGKLDDAKIEELAEKRAEGIIKSRVAPIERENKKLAKERDEALEQNTAFKSAERTRKIHDKTRAALTSAKVLPEAHDDALLLAERIFDVDEEGNVVAKENVGVPPGLDPAGWLSEIQDRKPHWWPGSVGGGARGTDGRGGVGGGKNPWKRESWNLTEQGKIVREKGEDVAQRLAEAAGTTVGGLEPPART